MLNIFDSIKDWFVERAINSVQGLIISIANDALEWAFDLINLVIIELSRLDQYFNYKPYLFYIQLVAGGLLALAVAWNCLKQVSGNTFGNEDVSIGTIVIRIVIAGALIWFLPWSVPEIFIRANNALIGLINSVGLQGFTPNTLNSIGDFIKAANFNWIFLFLVLIIALGLCVIAILGGIRYIELIIAVLVAPFVACRFVDKPESTSVWVREVVALTFTQALHVFLLRVLASILTSVNNLAMPILAIGVVVVMIRGPYVLRKFLYTTGIGSAGVSTVGQVGRWQAMKFILAK